MENKTMIKRKMLVIVLCLSMFVLAVPSISYADTGNSNSP